MSFKRDYTYPCVAASVKRSDRQAHEDTRCSLFGNGTQARIPACLLTPQLKEWTYSENEPNLASLVQAAEQTTTSESSEEETLVRALCRVQSRRGREIRLENWPENLPRRPGLQALDPGWWSWKAVICCHYETEGEPIAALEGRGYLLALRWRLWNVKNLEKRTVHLLDSQTCVSAFVKHRSRASSMSFLCKRASALELGSGCQMTLAYGRSHCKPADEPSHRPKSPSKRSTKKDVPASGAAKR